MQKTPKGLRLHIGIFGRRNVGKSSVLNVLTGQQSAIVSEQAGTTTDPVEKPMELLPVGPVLFVDTAGIDDIGALGEKRIAKTRGVIQRSDLALLVFEKNNWGDFESELLEEFDKLGIPVITVLNKTDLYDEQECNIAPVKNKDIPFCYVSALKEEGFAELKRQIIISTPKEFTSTPSILGDLIQPGRTVVLVVPIDKEAPKGRLILPQVQSIRDILDSDSVAVVCKERELSTTFNLLKEKPGLVVTDSQAFLKVAADTPEDVMMTSFSILFARYKADLAEMVKGALAIENLTSGDKVLIAESCTHHPITDDIGTVKIPRWLKQYAGGKIEFEHSRGHDLSPDLQKYKLIIHCGACMWNRREMLSRIMLAKEAGVPITNYGLTIAYTLGIFERALKPFGYAHQVYQENRIANNRRM